MWGRQYRKIGKELGNAHTLRHLLHLQKSESVICFCIQDISSHPGTPQRNAQQIEKTRSVAGTLDHKTHTFKEWNRFQRFGSMAKTKNSWIQTYITTTMVRSLTVPSQVGQSFDGNGECKSRAEGTWNSSAWLLTIASATDSAVVFSPLPKSPKKLSESHVNKCQCFLLDSLLYENTTQK